MKSKWVSEGPLSTLPSSAGCLRGWCPRMTHAGLLVLWLRVGSGQWESWAVEQRWLYCILAALCSGSRCAPPSSATAPVRRPLSPGYRYHQVPRSRPSFCPSGLGGPWLPASGSPLVLHSPYWPVTQTLYIGPSVASLHLSLRDCHLFPTGSWVVQLRLENLHWAPPPFRENFIYYSGCFGVRKT